MGYYYVFFDVEVNSFLGTDFPLLKYLNWMYALEIAVRCWD